MNQSSTSFTDQALAQLSGQKIRIKKYAPKIDYLEEMQELRDENTRLQKAIEWYSLLVLGLIGLVIGMFILGFTMGRSL